MSLLHDKSSKVSGKKRKRHMEVEDDLSLKLAGKLHHYLKEVRKAAKKAKAFETQRLVKKLKDLQKPNYTGAEDAKVLETQLESLKRTDHERIAHLSLSSKFQKDKVLSSNSGLMTSMASVIYTTTHDDDTKPRNTKVERRLLSSKILAAASQEAVRGIRAVLEPGMTAKAHSIVRNAESANNRQKQDQEVDKNVADAFSPALISAGDSSNEGDIEETWTVGQVSDEVGDMVDQDGWESGSIDDIEPSGSDENNLNESNSPRIKAKPLSSSLLGSSGQSRSTVASTFLPSLSVGYINGESESDIAPSDGDTAAKGRKNRRGQRARQAIWEKRYGRNAKHLRTQREAAAQPLVKHPDKGWDGRQHGTSQSANVSMWPAKKKRQAPIQIHSRTQDIDLPSEKPTHPSWEAKRKLKEKEGARILPSQGKKIIFT